MIKAQNGAEQTQQTNVVKKGGKNEVPTKNERNVSAV